MTEARIALYIRIPVAVAQRIDAGMAAHEGWPRPNKQDYIIGLLDNALPGGKPKRDPRQLDIEDVINGKAKARKATRKPARAKVAKRSKAKARKVRA
jgi:hypothetical protein